MAVPTVDHRQRGSPANPRARALTRRIAELGLALPADEGRLEALALGLVDALLEADETTLRAALGALRDARGRALAAEPERSGARAVARLAGGHDRRRPLGARAAHARVHAGRGRGGHPGVLLPAGARALHARRERRAAAVARDGRDPGEPHRAAAARQRPREPPQGGPSGVLGADAARPARARAGARGLVRAEPARRQRARRGVLLDGGDPPRLRGGGRRRAGRAPRRRSDARADRRVLARTALRPGDPGDHLAADRRLARVYRWRRWRPTSRRSTT